jgi:transposase
MLPALCGAVDDVEVLGSYRQIRMRYDPALRIYLIADNLSTHKTPAIREWADQSNVELVFTPTYASFLKTASSVTSGRSPSS